MQQGKRRRKLYQGTLNVHSKKITNPEVKRAIRSYYDQRGRCYNPNNKGYKFSGAKGVRVEYSCREFVTWWLENISTRSFWLKPTCGRLDHSKSYNFDNIQMQESAENTRERNLRWELGRPDIEMTYQGLRFIFKTPGEASRITGIAKSLLLDILNGKIEQEIDKPAWRLIPRR